MKEELSMEFNPFISDEELANRKFNPFIMSDEELANCGSFDIEVPEDDEMETYNDYDLVTDLHLLHGRLQDLKASGVTVEVINGKLTISHGETTISKWI